MPTVYSHSRLSVFQDCRLRYRLKYVDRVKRDLDGVESFLGSRVHEALESLYRDVLMGRQPTAESLLDGYRREWDAQWHGDVVVSSDRYVPADYRAAGEECLRRYYARHAPFRADQTLGVEVRISVELPGGARLDGFADRVARDPDGGITIHDYKTSSTLPSQADVDRDRQLALYQAGVEKMWPGAPTVRLVWHFLRFDERLVSVRTREQMAALLSATAALVEEVESEREWRPTVTPLCNWCPYWDLCPEKKHEWAIRHSAREEPSLLPSPAPAAEDAARLVDDAVQALARRAAAERDLEAAKARLLDYARATGSTRVESATGSAVVRMGETPALPARKDEGHDALRAALAAAGLDSVYADLHAGRLLRALREGSLPPDLERAVREQLRPRPGDAVRVYRKSRDGTPEDPEDADGAETA
jgi:putative RecB family exonuclease